ncbi:hypothetical protein NMB1695 [Neisseria meningitidis MC58]|uniref:Uncharacterized protein n=1 Tax=Neisseria meningitidis serogroup B (strain ATCC BAA-335 / MC58) TaxID=122586 RepID=Q9JY85_NEIMB|nr:hypothetical protein NMB1695 [Neisseria meningitidis MC58]
MELQQRTLTIGLGNDIAVQTEGVGFIRGQLVADHAEINSVFKVVVKAALIVVKTLFADGYPHAIFQRFLMPDNRNRQHRADKAVGLVGIADDAEIRIAFCLISNAFFFTELIIGIGCGKADCGHFFVVFAAGSASVHKVSDFQNEFAVKPFAGKQHPHQYIGNHAGINRPPIISPQPCQQSGKRPVDYKKYAPNLRYPAGIAHGFFRQVGLLQPRKFFNHRLPGKQAAAEHRQHHQIDEDGIPIHRIMPPEHQYCGKKQCNKQSRITLLGQFGSQGAQQPQPAHRRRQPNKPARLPAVYSGLTKTSTALPRLAVLSAASSPCPDFC